MKVDDEGSPDENHEGVTQNGQQGDNSIGSWPADIEAECVEKTLSGRNKLDDRHRQGSSCGVE